MATLPQLVWAVKTPVLTEQPSFLGIEKCPLLAKELIVELKIDSNKIHSCSINSEDLFASKKKVEVVNIDYGDPDDCPAGCIYKNITAVVDVADGIRRFYRVPFKKHTLNLKDFPQFSAKSNRKDFLCEFQYIEEITKYTFGKKNGHWGLYMELKKPLVCTWVEVVSTIYPVDYTRSLNKGFKVRGEWTGLVFLKSTETNSNQESVSSTIDVNLKEIQHQQIEWEEQHTLGK